jgi:hypothetical protein
MKKSGFAVVFLVLLLLFPLGEFALANYYHVGPPKGTVLAPLPDYTYSSQSDIPIKVQVQMYSNSFPYWEHLRSIRYSLDEHPAVNLTTKETVQSGGGGYDASGTGTLSDIPKGPHELHIYVETQFSEDSKLHSVEATVYFVVDSVEPHIRVSSPQAKTYSGTNVPLAFLGDKGLTWAGYSLDHTQIATCPNMLTNLPTATTP